MFAPVCDFSVFELKITNMLKSSGWELEQKITNMLKSSGWGLEQSELPWEQNSGVFPMELLACQLSMICTANWQRYLCLCT